MPTASPSSRSSRRAIFAAGAGGVVFGAFLVIVTAGPLSRPPAPPARASDEGGPPPVSRLPPGWDPRFSSRLAAVERRLADLDVAPDAAAATTGAPNARGVAEDLDDQREQEVDQQYQRDLARQRQLVEAHAAEPVDPAWAQEQTASIRAELQRALTGEHAFAVSDVDCRDKTCLARLVYPSPDDALAGRGQLAQVLVRGCHGLSSALEPPTGAGPYTTTLIYTCR
jgi:hypothetical protein